MPAPLPSAFPPTSAQAASGLPSFLDFDAADGAAGAGVAPPSAQLLAPRGAAGNTVFPFPSAAATPAVDSAAAEAERQRRELRDLNATLDALAAEQQRLEERLDTREVKEETELLALETSVMTKTNELTDKEEELAARRIELAQHTAERLTALSSRYGREMEAQAAEVRSLDRARYEKQLQNVRSQLKTVEESVRGLREQAALAVAMEPFSETGVRVAVAAATSEATDGEGSAVGQTEESMEGSVATLSLERGLEKAVELLRAYCDQRLNHARSRLVDYVHTESIEAAHAVRRTREQSWADDALHHKTLFSQYMVDMMQRYMVFYKERASLKQQNITSLQAELQSTAAELRRRAAARLQELLANVTAKMSLSAERQTKSAEEAKRILHQKMQAIVEADAAAALAQRKELESRLLIEAQSRRQRLVAEEQALLDQLHRLRRSSEAAARDNFHSLLDAATSSGVSLAQSLAEEVASLKARVSEKVQGDAAPLTALRTASSTAHMHAEELLHVVRRSLDAEAAQQHSLSLSHQRCDEMRGELFVKLREDVVGQLQKSRCAQHAHQLRIDAQRKMWEAAHRQNLAAACSLLLSVSGSTTGTADAQYAVETYAAPQDVVSVALLDVLRDKLQSRDDARRRLLQDRRASSTRCHHLIEGVREQREVVQTAWDDVWTSSQAQQAQHRVSHEVQLEVEKTRVSVAAQQQAAERERRQIARECRRIADVTRRLQAEAAECGVSRDQLCAPPEVLEAAAAAAMPSSSASFLRPVDPATINQLPSTSKFTAVHASTNSIAAVAPAAHDAEASASPAAAPFSLDSSPLPLPPPNGKAATATSQQLGSALDVAETSNATATQPWSSALLRAERLLSSSNADDTDVLPRSAPGSSVVADGDARPSVRPETKSSSSSVCSGNLEPRGGDGAAASTSPSLNTEEKHRSSSSSRGLDIPPHMVSSTWQNSSETAPRERRTRPSTDAAAASLWRLQQLPSRNSALGETWSTLEEFRSGVGRSSSALRDRQAALEEGTTLSFDDSTNFVELLSCSDSPASSHRAY